MARTLPDTTGIDLPPPEPRLGPLARVYPIGAYRTEDGRLHVGGCDVIEIASEFGTPAYVYAEDDLRARARMFVEAFAGRTERFEVVWASKAFPCTAANRVLAQEGLACDVASGGELHLALRGGFAPERIYMHGNNKSEAELAYAIDRRIGHIVLDSFHEIERLERLLAERDRRQAVMLRVTPGITPSTYPAVQTGQVDSKFGFAMEDVPGAIERCAHDSERLELDGLHAHIGSQIFDLEPYRRLGELLTEMGDYPLLNLGGGLGVAYTADDEPPAIDDYVEQLLSGAPDHVTVLCEPGRSLVANAGVTVYTVGTVKRVPGVRTYVGVDGGMSDNLRPMLYGARYAAELADRHGGDALCTIAGMHCESGDVLIRDIALDDPVPGDVLVVPATGAYGHAMANNYNAVPRPPVIFCRDGDARVVVRRETYEDIARRDV
jgi:diaminopimelate decarboxylase